MKKSIKLPVNLKIEKIVPGGQAIATMESGQKAFIWNALPEETVTELQITKRKTHYIEGIATKIINPSKIRITPKDDCFLSTSPWQIMDYKTELTEKQNIVKELFRQNNLPETKINNIITDNKDFFYRNKMEYSLFYDHDTNSIHLSFHVRGTHQKIPIKSSSIERPEIFNRALEVIKDLNQSSRRASDFQSLILRCNQQGVVSGGLLENYQPHPNFTSLTDSILDQEYTYSPNGFFQINLPVYELALKYIKPHIKTNKVLDLYAGVGSIGLSVASDKNLALVEVNTAAHAEMIKNCENVSSKTGNTNINPILAKSEEVLEFIAPDVTVILDPPRAGCDIKLLEKLIEKTPETIVYMSCNPATLARDLKILVNSNKYKITEVTPFNFFPRTPHIEAITILTTI